MVHIRQHTEQRRSSRPVDVRTIKEYVEPRGYADGFEGLISYINGPLPQNEEIGQALRKEVRMYPGKAIRELVPNAMIHQDFTMTGDSPLAEIFADRIEFTNAGTPLIDPLRFIQEAVADGQGRQDPGLLSTRLSPIRLQRADDQHLLARAELVLRRNLDDPTFPYVAMVREGIAAALNQKDGGGLPWSGPTPTNRAGRPAITSRFRRAKRCAR